MIRLSRDVVDPVAARLIERIGKRTAVIGIIGLGYVGLPLAIEFCKCGFTVVGFDVEPTKVDALMHGRSYIRHIPDADVEFLHKSARFAATCDFSSVERCDAVLVCVPTPLTRHREPDMSYIEDACDRMRPYVRKGQLIVLESTTYPGTTEEVVVPRLTSGGLTVGDDGVYVAYSPEREDPGNKLFRTANIPKVVGGMTQSCLDAACALYSSVIHSVVPVSSVRIAEATKLVENIFRCVNIAMVNELKMVFERMDVDIWEVIGAAKTKPFGYMPFYPGPGLGGHCIPIDPFYLTWKAREFDMPTRFIELAGEINTQMPHYVVQKTVEAMNWLGMPVNGSRILLVGVAYKPDVDDMRESPSVKLFELYEHLGAKVSYHDPYIPSIERGHAPQSIVGRQSVCLSMVSEFDAVVVCTAHSSVDYAAIGRDARLIVDTRNAMAGTVANCPVFKA